MCTIDWVRRIIPLLIACCLFLTACLQSHTTIEVHPADLVSFDIELLMTKSVAEATNANADTIAESAKKRLPEAAKAITTVTPIDEEQWVGVRVTTLPIPADQASQFVRYTRQGNKARVEFPVNHLKQVQPGVNLLDLKESGVEVTLEAKFPGKVISTNGQVNGQSVTWDVLNTDGEPWAEAQVGPDLPMIILIGVLAGLGTFFVLTGTYRLIKRRRAAA